MTTDESIGFSSVVTLLRTVGYAVRLTQTESLRNLGNLENLVFLFVLKLPNLLKFLNTETPDSTDD